MGEIHRRVPRGYVYAFITGFAAFGAGAPQAQNRPIEEVIVTGSHILGSAEDAALPIEVTTRGDLEDLGMPSINELVRSLGVTSGNLAESNQFVANGAEGVSTINLRGLGSARTLTLLNGKRHVPTETTGVDVSALPFSAIGRVEILKDGAAALYGSDAIAGVVNLITRSGFEGLEIRGSQQFIEDSDGDPEVNVLYGIAGDSVDWLVAAEYQRRNELRIRDRDWALRSFEENPAGGWSSIGMPGRALPAFPGIATPENPGGLLGAGAPDPNCELLGGSAPEGNPSCHFQYTWFDNLIEEQDTYKVYSEMNWEISPSARLHAEALYSKMDMTDNFKTSPAYAPQSLFGPDRYIAPSHPGLQLYKEQNPEHFPALGPLAPELQGAYSISRALGVDGFRGDSQTGSRETETIRVGLGLAGSLFDEQLDYDIGVTYSTRERYISGSDMYVERMAFALDGLGGPNCDPATGTPGVGDCLYFNPFGNSIERSVITGATNPDFQQTYNGYRIDNPQELIDWLNAEQELTFTNHLTVFDAVFSGLTPWSLPGGAIGWAAGAQARNERYEAEYAAVNDLTINPCPFSNPLSVSLGNVASLDCAAPTGPLGFLAGATPSSTRRTIYGMFFELALPFSDTLDAQFAARFEDYGGEVGSTIDPKLAVRWQATDWLALRGSASSTFRGPPQSLLSGRITGLQFVAPTNAFRAIDTVGNPNLDPEKALTMNLGVLLDFDQFKASLDWWRYDFTDPFQLESFSQLVTAYVTEDCQDGGAGVGSALCASMRSHIFPLGTEPGEIERVEVNWINGADIETSGLDLYGEYFFDDVMGGDVSLGLQATYTLEYKSDDFKEISGQTMAEGGDFVGQLNTGLAPFTPLPELKGNVFAKIRLGGHRLTYQMHYVDSYDDTRTTTLPNLRSIDSHVTHDLHYNWSLMEDSLLLTLSALNLTDEDPPRVQLDANYDPYTHNPFGRMVKLGFRYNLGGQ